MPKVNTMIKSILKENPIQAISYLVDKDEVWESWMKFLYGLDSILISPALREDAPGRLKKVLTPKFQAISNEKKAPAGVDAYLDFVVEKATERYVFWKRISNNELIRVGGDEATIKAYITFLYQRKKEDGSADVMQSTTSLARAKFVRTKHGWQIYRFECKDDPWEE